MSAKVNDEHNRWGNKIVAFRMSPEEAAERKDIPLEFVLSALTVRGSVS